ncbi:MAG: hypothetical protein KDA76_00035 [Planctomycetaceae bacterium]|nr:hypothetical protein [Planctomycetaceae bacterium]
MMRHIPGAPAPVLPAWQRLGVGLLGVLPFFLGLAITGCHTIDARSPEGSRKPLLAPLQAGIDAVQLDIVFVERDNKDPLLTRMLWDEIDQVGTVDLQTRSRLRDAGFRVGLVGMSPPRSLQRLLGFSSDITDTAGTSRHKELAGRSVLLRSQGETEIQTSPIYPELMLKLPGSEEPVKLLNARFVLRVQLERLQDGWVNLHITPEIHHGNSQLRPVAGASNWELKGTQEVKSFEDLQFSVALNVGEMVVLSADHESEHSIADQFFVNRDVQRPQRRLVVVRLSDMKKIEPLYTE